MRTKRTAAVAAVVTLAGSALVVAGTASAGTSGTTLCVNKKTGAVRIAGCTGAEKKVVVATQGVRGPQGVPGPQGPQGPGGANGLNGKDGVTQGLAFGGSATGLSATTYQAVTPVSLPAGAWALTGHVVAVNKGATSADFDCALLTPDGKTPLDGTGATLASDAFTEAPVVALVKSGGSYSLSCEVGDSAHPVEVYAVVTAVQVANASGNAAFAVAQQAAQARAEARASR